MTPTRFKPSRRRLLKLLLAAPIASVMAMDLLAPDDASAAAALLAATASGRNETPTPPCDDGDEPTLAETEGPFFKPRSPERTSLLEPGTKGTRLELSGRVLGHGCRPLAGALLDFWHADDGGVYDTEGFRLRGHQYTDAEGRYQLSTIVPGPYGGRTRHIHVRVQPAAPARSAAGPARALTTQLYFPGEPRNRSDGLFRAELLVSLDAARTPRLGRFHFLLDA